MRCLPNATQTAAIFEKPALRIFWGAVQETATPSGSIYSLEMTNTTLTWVFGFLTAAPVVALFLYLLYALLKMAWKDRDAVGWVGIAVILWFVSAIVFIVLDGNG